MATDLVERVARALRDESDRQLNEKSSVQYPPSKVETYLGHARAALAAMPSVTVTDAMIEAGCKMLVAWLERPEGDEADDIDAVTAIYLAMRSSEGAGNE